MHLAGWDDHEAEEAKQMARIQETVLRGAVEKVGSK
ncbi:ssRNA-specific RNase YbeY (16S rRNA maturation enzyme) [Prosthecobacter vanneervenii]|uniref:SsRNA-specific RNase YbeY (16S rRNA maturation enzyme) n=1 Tax=Prosthecobacter vanneervenii TaxID=48466 RepID=A0A7W7Y8U1_9BACT|nr:ssRNA-specific RNase YbeY (16S rRNA maturation enzyme) [Prosthecobacter vanneervenii]